MNLAPINVSPERVVRYATGLRPFRRSGFVVRSEQSGDKTVIHNYGHGGCGVTLSWGTAMLAVEEAKQTTHRSAAVLGCGAVGLATARLLQEAGFQVAIYTKELPPDTTSNVAGACWLPVTIYEGEVSLEFKRQLERACRFAHHRFESLLGERYGVRWLPVYGLGHGEPGDGLLGGVGYIRDLFPGVRVLREPHRFFGFEYAHHFRTLMIEPSRYLAALVDDFHSAGGKLIVREFAIMDQILALREALVINCTGLGAKTLFRDDELVPIKGQLAMLPPQPEINYAYVVLDPDTDLYMFPRSDGILLGGSHERGKWSLEANPQEARRILDGHRTFFRTQPIPRD